MSGKKKLLQINVTANWGSTGKIAEQLGVLAISQGWESYIAYGRMMNPSKSKLIKIGSQLDVYLHYAFGRFLDMEGLASIRATKKFVEVIGKIKPDIVHLHNIHDHYLNYPILFDFLATHDIPVVWTQHDQWATTGHCTYNMESCESWKTKCHDCPAKKRIAFDRSRNNFELKKRWFTLVKNSTIVTVSEWLKSQIAQSILGVYPIKVIKNGVDTKLFKPQDVFIKNKYGIANRKVLLGIAHPWSERKGLKDYIALSKIIPSDCVIMLVGLDEKQCESLPQNIIGLRAIQNISELVMIYNMADIVLNLSYAETFGMTTVEGFACGIPGIVYNKTASPELITPETGIIVETGDIEEVANAVNTLLANGKQHYSAACRKRAEECYDKDKCFEEYMKLYDSLLSR